MSETNETTEPVKVEQPEWTDAEHNEIMRMHIIEGLTISGAMHRVFEQRNESTKMGELIELPEDASWNATTGTFDKAGTRATEVGPEQFEELIAARFGASQLTPDQKEKAMGMLDNAAVYLHEVDPRGRLDRSPTMNSIASEWANLGLDKRQAEFMIETSLEHIARDQAYERDQTEMEM